MEWRAQVKQGLGNQGGLVVERLTRHRWIADNSRPQLTIGDRSRKKVICKTYRVTPQCQLNITAILNTGYHVLNNTAAESNSKCLRREPGRGFGRALKHDTALGDVEHHLDGGANVNLQVLPSLLPSRPSGSPRTVPALSLALCISAWSNSLIWKDDGRLIE